jgi:hypothetical protein
VPRCIASSAYGTSRRIGEAGIACPLCDICGMINDFDECSKLRLFFLVAYDL